MKLTTLKPRIQVMQAPAKVAVEVNPSSWRGDKKTAAQRGYGHAWRKARLAYLDKHQYCVYCRRRGEDTAATVVDHKIPHEGDWKLFWDSANNWQPLCKPCHDGEKKREEAAM